VSRLLAVPVLALAGAAASTLPEHHKLPPLPSVHTTTQTVTRTQQARVDGRNVHWWAHRARRNGHLMRARGITLHRIRRSLKATVRLGASGLERAFLCIHRFEGRWSDPDAPYYGGMQMDLDFMAAYAAPFLRAYGTADHWTAAMQVVTAERAYLEGRGFEPWPNTARMCGLR
jgi:hypothetical protein